MKSGVAWLLSLNGGYVDTAGFLALHGLFAAHVTGNFVTIAATLVYGSSGVLSKLLALPVFLLVVAMARVMGQAMASRPVLRPCVLLALQFALLLAGGGLGLVHGPFADGDAPAALATGMLLVCAMAIQNAVQRVHLASFPPTTLMTGNSTQLVLDLVDLLHPAVKLPDRRAVWQRVGRMAAGIGCFAAGCALAALLFWRIGIWCLALPPALVLAAFAAALREGLPPGQRPTPGGAG